MPTHHPSSPPCPSPLRLPKGRARKLSVKSLGWSALISYDGVGTVPLSYGAEAIITSPDDAALTSVVFDTW